MVKPKLGFFPLPSAEAKRLKNWLNFPEQFSALDPCVGDGVAFAHLLRDAPARRYGIKIDAYRAEQARALEIETVQANAMDVRCQAETVSLLYLALRTIGKRAQAITNDWSPSFSNTRIAGSSGWRAAVHNSTNCD